MGFQFPLHKIHENAKSKDLAERRKFCNAVITKRANKTALAT